MKRTTRSSAGAPSAFVDGAVRPNHANVVLRLFRRIRSGHSNITVRYARHRASCNVRLRGSESTRPVLCRHRKVEGGGGENTRNTWIMTSSIAASHARVASVVGTKLNYLQPS